MCGIEKKIAKHCDEEEIICSECESPMYYDDLRPEVLVCSNIGCMNEIHTD